MKRQAVKRAETPETPILEGQAVKNAKAKEDFTPRIKDFNLYAVQKSKSLNQPKAKEIVIELPIKKMPTQIDQ